MTVVLIHEHVHVMFWVTVVLYPLAMMAVFIETGLDSVTVNVAFGETPTGTTLAML
jgi:hypothetical protein